MTDKDEDSSNSKQIKQERMKICTPGYLKGKYEPVYDQIIHQDSLLILTSYHKYTNICVIGSLKATWTETKTGTNISMSASSSKISRQNRLVVLAYENQTYTNLLHLHMSSLFCFWLSLLCRHAIHFYLNMTYEP